MRIIHGHKSQHVKELSSVLLSDNIEVMKCLPDKLFDLACIDPPYGLNERLVLGGGKLVKSAMTQLYKGKSWDVLPSKEFFDELFRVSKNQIIWGGNYFLDYLPSTRGIIVWDKQSRMPTMSDAEIAWTSFDRPLKIYSTKSYEEKKIHPTQKPISLYKFCYTYARVQAGDWILDTHLGSQSSRIAAEQMGLQFLGIEKDEQHYREGNARYDISMSQADMFAETKTNTIEIFK